MDNGLFHPHHTRSRQDWRVAQLSPNIDREFSCYFLGDGTVLKCHDEQLRSLFVVAFRTMFPLPCRSRYYRSHVVSAAQGSRLALSFFFQSSKTKFLPANFGSAIEVMLEYLGNPSADQPAGGVE